MRQLSDDRRVCTNVRHSAKSPVWKRRNASFGPPGATRFSREQVSSVAERQQLEAALDYVREGDSFRDQARQAGAVGGRPAGDRRPAGGRSFDAAKSAAHTGVAVLVALASALLARPLKGGMAVVGGINLGGSIEQVNNPIDVVEHALAKGATTVLVPVSCRRPLVDLSDDAATKVQLLLLPLMLRMRFARPYMTVRRRGIREPVGRNDHAAADHRAERRIAPSASARRDLEPLDGQPRVRWG